MHQSHRITSEYFGLFLRRISRERFFHLFDALRPWRVRVRIIGAEENPLGAPSAYRFRNQRVLRLDRPMKMRQVLGGMFPGTAQMGARAEQQFAELPSRFHAIEEV